MLKKQMVYEEAFQNSPLSILNNFGGAGEHHKLMLSMFQSMFPTINLTNVSLMKLQTQKVR
jgi:ribosome biogenesis protein SSF1/2